MEGHREGNKEHSLHIPNLFVDTWLRDMWAVGKWKGRGNPSRPLPPRGLPSPLDSAYENSQGPCPNSLKAGFQPQERLKQGPKEQSAKQKESVLLFELNFVVLNTENRTSNANFETLYCFKSLHNQGQQSLIHSFYVQLARISGCAFFSASTAGKGDLNTYYPQPISPCATGWLLYLLMCTEVRAGFTQGHSWGKILSVIALMLKGGEINYMSTI